MGFSLRNPPFWGTPIYGNPQVQQANENLHFTQCFYHQELDSVGWLPPEIWHGTSSTCQFSWGKKHLPAAFFWEMWFAWYPEQVLYNGGCSKKHLHQEDLGSNFMYERTGVATNNTGTSLPGSSHWTLQFLNVTQKQSLPASLFQSFQIFWQERVRKCLKQTWLGSLKVTLMLGNA